MKKWVSSLALIAIAALGAGCRPSRAPGALDLTLTGRAQLVSASGKKTTLFRSQTIPGGHTVRMTSGTGVLQLSGGRQIELRKGSAVKVGDTPMLVAGDALLVADRSALTIKASGSSLTVSRGAARVTRHLAVDAATYEGTTAIASAGQRFTVPALRQARLASLGVLPTRADPLELHRTDPWDRRFLGDAIELSEQLDARSAGLTGQLPSGQGRSAGFVTSVLPELRDEHGFDAALIDGSRAPGETVVGAAIAMAGHGGSFGSRWTSLFQFRDEGAAWGLVALDQRVTDVPKLSSTMDAALGRAESYSMQAAAPPPPAVTEPTEPAPTTPAPTATVPHTAATAPPSAGGSGAGGTDRSNAPPTTTPNPVVGVVDTVGNVVSGLVNTLLGQ